MKATITIEQIDRGNRVYTAEVDGEPIDVRPSAEVALNAFQVMQERFRDDSQSMLISLNHLGTAGI